MNYPTIEYKNISSKEDEFAELLETIVSVVVVGYGR